jgi:hypothetical protein
MSFKNYRQIFVLIPTVILFEFRRKKAGAESGLTDANSSSWPLNRKLQKNDEQKENRFLQNHNEHLSQQPWTLSCVCARVYLELFKKRS